MRSLRILAGLAIALALLPAVSAHTPITSADSHVRASVGLLNEPVSTYAVTGLDICFTENPASAPRAALANVQPGNFTVTLTAPTGETHTDDLKAQFGRTGCVTFAEPMVLTQPGQYTVAISGSVNGTTFSATGVAAGGKVVDRSNITFPANAVSNDQQLQGQIDALKTQLQDSRERITALEAKPQGKTLPSPAAALLFVGIAVLAAVRRSRA